MKRTGTEWNILHRQRSGTPEAELIDVRGQRAKVACPYCSRTHIHEVRAPGRQWFAPSCGLYLSPDDRAAGYTFTTTR